MNNTDETDHHPHQHHRQEITIAVGGENDGTINIKTTHLTPTPSPRSLESSQGAADGMSTNSTTDDDNAILTSADYNNHAKSHNADTMTVKQQPNGIDNLAFENDINKTSQQQQSPPSSPQQRPLSSFGNGVDANGEGHHGKDTGTVEKPLTGKISIA